MVEIIELGLVAEVNEMGTADLETINGCEKLDHKQTTDDGRLCFLLGLFNIYNNN